MLYSPKKHNSVILAVICTVLMLASVFMLGYHALGSFSLLGLPIAVVAIQLAQRYMLTSYVYRLTPSDELDVSNDLAVIKVQNNTEKTVCNLSLYEAKELVEIKSLRELEKRYGKVATAYNFCAEPFAQSAYWLIEEFNGSRIAVKLQCDEEFAQELRRRIGVRSEAELFE